MPLPYMAKFCPGKAATRGSAELAGLASVWPFDDSQEQVGSRYASSYAARAQQSLRAPWRQQQTQADSTFWRGCSGAVYLL